MLTMYEMTCVECGLHAALDYPTMPVYQTEQNRLEALENVHKQAGFTLNYRPEKSHHILVCLACYHDGYEVAGDGE